MLHTESGTGILAPGQTDTLSFRCPRRRPKACLSLVSMLVNTNDAVAAVNDAHLDLLAAGDANLYPAHLRRRNRSEYGIGRQRSRPCGRRGEKALTRLGMMCAMPSMCMPGGDQEDGLASSTLTGEHRWDHPAVQVRVTRMD